MVKPKNNNNNKGDGKSPGGTSNAGTTSPGDSSQLSDGVFVSPGNRDIKPDLGKENSYASILKGNPYEPLEDADDNEPRDLKYVTSMMDNLMGTLSESDRLQLMSAFATAYASHTGLTFTKLHPTTDENTTTPHQDTTGWNQGMFTGRETPMQVGFRPNTQNFSRRDETPLMTTSDQSPSAPAPTGSSNIPTSFGSTIGHQHSTHAVPTTRTVGGGTNHEQGNNPTPFVSATRTTGHGFGTDPVIPTPSVGATGFRSPPPTTTATGLNNTPIDMTSSSNVQSRWAAGPSLSNGLTLRANARPDIHAAYDNDRVIISRSQRGVTDKEKAKIREICTTAITPKITRGNISKLLTTTDADYDIAEDAARWQTSLADIWRHVIQYDFKLIVMIPYSFDPTDVNSVPQTTELVNGVLDHDKLTDHHYFAWQSFLRRFALEPELISDAWLHDKLWKSLDDELKAEIRSDFDDLPHECKGSISLLHLIINRMVKNNQESRRAMEEFIKTFDIQKFPGEDVTKATLRLKAIAQSLGTNRLPSDIVHRVLEGFARASTPTFSNLCHHQKSMISSSLVKANLRQDTLYKTLISVLTDLDNEYNELLSGHRWLGISHNALPSRSVFVANSPVNEDDTDDEYANYVVFTARTGRPSLPFHVWVKDKLCRHCHEMGHIITMVVHPLVAQLLLRTVFRATSTCKIKAHLVGVTTMQNRPHWPPKMSSTQTKSMR